VVIDQCFIKYNSHNRLYYQYLTQNYVYEQTVGDVNAPRAYDYFVTKDMMGHLVI